MKILAVADEVDRRVYGAQLRTRMAPELIVGCGDVPAYYLDYLVSQLDVPLYAVHGNHDTPPGQEEGHAYKSVGATWLGGRVARINGLLLAGFDGSLRYNDGAYQSTQVQMHAAVRALVPALLLNKLRYGRYLDVLVTHAPPRGVHDQRDACHTGFDAYRWLIEHFRPRYHLHGHVHIYDRRTATVTRLGATEVTNVYPYRELTIEVPETRSLFASRRSGQRGRERVESLVPAQVGRLHLPPGR